MLRVDTEAFRDEILQEVQAGTCLGSVLTRTGGAGTFVALLFWIYGGVSANQWITERGLMQKFSIYLEHSLEVQDAAEALSNGAASGESPTLEVRARELQELTWKREEFKKQFNRYAAIQGLIQIVWLVVMILTGVFMLCAAIAGLAGSARSRGWHRQVVYWTLLSTTCTVGGLLALARWGGFPPIEDIRVLVKIAAVQSSYAIVVMLALLIFRRPTDTHAVPG